MLSGSQNNAHLHQMNGGGTRKLRGTARDAKDVRHQSSATGTKLDKPEGRGATRKAPNLDQPGADDLAEHLADLGRGGEIAGDTEGIPRHVVAVGRVAEAVGHVV